MKVKVVLVIVIAALLLSSAALAQYGYGRSDCSNAQDRATSAASDLSGYARRLQRCADSGDFTDDCSAEFRRVKYAHGDYESALSDVSMYCD